MEIHKYEVICYGSIIDFTHHCRETQIRLYIPGQDVFGYRSKEQIDFFSDDITAIEEALSIIGGEKDKGEKYLGKLNLPEDEVMKMISAGRNLNNARNEFKKVSQTLIEMVEGK